MEHIELLTKHFNNRNSFIHKKAGASTTQLNTLLCIDIVIASDDAGDDQH